MPDGVGNFAGAYAAARDAVQAIGARLDALAGGADDGLAALVARLGTLPAAATQMPFGEAAAIAQGLAGESASEAKRVAKPRGSGARTTPSKPAAMARPAASKAGPAARQPAAHAPTATAPGAAPNKMFEPDLAGLLLVQPALDTVAALARLTRTSPPAERRTGSQSVLAAPAAVAQQVAQWMAGQLERAATPSLGLGGSSGASNNLGRLGADMLAVQELIERSLAGLGAPARRDGKRTVGGPKQADAGAAAGAASPPAAPTDVAARTGLPEPAPRAASKLLTPAGDASDPVATDRADAPQGTEIADDPIDAMTRALVDQAWLRGVDLR